MHPHAPRIGNRYNELLKSRKGEDTADFWRIQAQDTLFRKLSHPVNTGKNYFALSSSDFINFTYKKLSS